MDCNIKVKATCQREWFSHWTLNHYTNHSAKALIDQENPTLTMNCGHHSMVDMAIRNVSWVNKSPMLEEREMQSATMVKKWKEKY